MKAVIDQQLPPALAAWLRDQSVDAIHVRDLDMSQAPDAVIVAWAEENDAVVISRDDDFIRLVRASPVARLVWVRLGNCTNASLLEAFRTAWPQIRSRIEAGERLVELRG